MTDGNKIIDSHVHTFVSDEVAARIIETFNRVYGIEFVNSGTGTVGDVLANMDRHGIDFTVLANFAPPKILHANNLWTIDAARRFNSLVPLVSFNPFMEGRLADLLDEYVAMGAKGVKLHPMAQEFDPGHERMREIYDRCSETAFPVVFHCGRVSNTRLNGYSDIGAILPVIDEYPDMPVVLTHMADGNIDDIIMLAGKYKNVYFDTSIVITGYPPIMRINSPSWSDDSVAVDMINRVGAHRILFGSDYPWGSPGYDLHRFRCMKLDNIQKNLILGRNSAKLFRIESTGNLTQMKTGTV